MQVLYKSFAQRTCEVPKLEVLVQIPEGVLAFIPNPLPPEITIDHETADLLAEAARAMGELKGIGQKLPNP